MKKIVVVLVLIIAVAGFIFFINRENIISPLRKEKLFSKERPLDKYAFANLKNSDFSASSIRLNRVLKENAQYISQIFYFDVENKKVSGLVNIPKNTGVYPVILMLRGFVPIESYTTGVGSKRAGEILAQNGFITLAPDFLGYGESDNPSKYPMEERFQTYTTVITLLSSLENLNRGLDASYSGKIKVDTSKVGIWGHSNGGQIALSILEITGKNYPTVLWAPVSKPFPYSILYYTDEFDDHGKKLRRVLANFEKDYDVELYSLTNFLDWIKASIQVNQGTDDDAVPQKWSDELVEKLNELEKDVEYFTYQNSDHNLIPSGWSSAVQRSMDFYREKFER